MPDSINEKILLAIKQHIPHDKNVVSVLMELLSLSKESAYRRIRNEIYFTIDELVKISNRFGISIDDIIDSGTITSKWATVNLDKLFTPEGYIKQYCERLENNISILKEVESAKKASVHCAYNTLPYSYLLPHRKLMQLWHYKWLFLTKGANPNFHFADLIFPPELIELEKRFFNGSRKIPKTVLILDKDVFRHVINDIHFFITSNLYPQMTFNR